MATRYAVIGRKPGEQHLRMLLKPQAHSQLAREAKERFQREGFIDVSVRETLGSSRR
jgi:hypothetical protein